MSVLGNIKTRVARRRLKKEIKKLVRNRQFVNFSEAKNIGILYLLDSEETYRDVAAYVASLQGQQKKVKIIGLFYGDLQPLYYIPKLSFDLIMSKDTNWYGRPTADFVNNFLNEQFDILFYFANDTYIPLEYIFSLADSKLKVSNGFESIRDSSDFIVEVEEEDNISKFLKTAIYYLSVINKNDEIQ